MTQDDFLNSVNRNIDRIYEYQLGHDGSDGKCDCIGLIIGAVRLTGNKWPWTHGSNYAARNRVNNLHYVSSGNEQELGNLVFKARKPGEEKYDLPSTYKNHSDQRDYYHVGVVTNVSPLVISHCTSVEGGIKYDKNLGAWHYAGELNQIEKGGNAVNVDYQAEVMAEKGSTVNLRSSPTTKAGVLKAVPVGSVVSVEEECDDEWAKVRYEDVRGYMMRKFLSPLSKQLVAITLEKDVALALLSALQGSDEL